MRFGVFYELQLPKPWDEGSEHRLFHEALDQVVFTDWLGIDSAWAVEHNFLEEYSHRSAPEVFLAAAVAERAAKKAAELAPYLEAALARKPPTACGRIAAYALTTPRQPWGEAR